MWVDHTLWQGSIKKCVTQIPQTIPNIGYDYQIRWIKGQKGSESNLPLDNFINQKNGNDKKSVPLERVQISMQIISNHTDDLMSTGVISAGMWAELF